MFQSDSFQSDAFQEQIISPNQGGDPGPLPSIGLLLEPVTPGGISIPVIMNQLRSQGQA